MKSIILLTTLLLAAPAVLRATDVPAKKPNLLFIYTDDHRWDATDVVQRDQGEQKCQRPGFDHSASFIGQCIYQHCPFPMVVGLKSPHNKRGEDNLPERLRDLNAGETSHPLPNCGLTAFGSTPVAKQPNDVPVRWQRFLRNPAPTK